MPIHRKDRKTTSKYRGHRTMGRGKKAGRELRVMSVKDRRHSIEGALQNPGSTGSFSTMALFSPDGKTMTSVTSQRTASGAESRTTAVYVRR